jgi:ArsR family metal-binding transcriptional regulator
MSLEKISELPCRADLGKLKFEDKIDTELPKVVKEIEKQFAELGV